MVILIWDRCDVCETEANKVFRNYNCISYRKDVVIWILRYFPSRVKFVLLKMYTLEDKN